MSPETADRLQVLVFGAGAVGTYIGGSLSRAGHRAVFLERPSGAAVLRQHGLILGLPDGEYRNPTPEVAESLSAALAAGPFDVALFALKSFDTLPTAADLQATNRQGTAHPLPPCLCLQNGVENETLLRRHLGEDRVIAGTVTSSIGRQGVGRIQLERLRGVGVANEHPLAHRLVSALSAAGLNARLYPQGEPMKWSKLLTNLIGNASAAILDMTPAEIFADRGLSRMEVAQLQEALAVMAAKRIRVVDLPGTPVRALAFAVKSLPEPLRRPLLQRALGGGRGGKMPSFHIDLHSGRGKSEVDFLNGAVVRFGIEAGVPTPVNRGLTEILTGLIHQEIPLDRFRRNPTALLAALTNAAYS